MLTRASIVIVVIAAFLAPSAVQAAEPAPTASSVTWSGDLTAETGVLTTVHATVTLADGTPPDGYVVIVEQGSGTAWTELSRSTSTSISQRVRVHHGTVQLRARLIVNNAEAASDTMRVTGTRARVSATLSMPSSGKDYQVITATLRAKRTHDGRPQDLETRLRIKRKGATTWRTLKMVRLGGNGVKKITLRLRHDSSFRIITTGTSTLVSATSATRVFDNRPPGAPVVIPKGASKPSIKLPAQPRADRAAADARISTLSNAVWASMKGRTWRAGCPVGRSGLRIVRVSYWAFDGYVRRGEIVVKTSAATRTARIFTDLFKKKVPIRSMYRVDRFGYSKTVKGGNDLRSMSADNTSGFNCRQVVGQPGTLSPHSTGGSIDVNPWENPFRSRAGYKPNATWAKRVHPVRVTYRTSTDPVVRIFAKHGFRWLGFADLQHFQD